MTHFIGAVVAPPALARAYQTHPTKYPDLYGKDALSVIPDPELRDFLSAALHRYDEDREVEIWTSREDVVKEVRESIEKYQNTIYAKYLADPDEYAADCFNPAHLQYLREGFPAKLAWTDEQCYVEGIEDHETREDGARLDTYNPDSKWDWYTIGGRWEEIYRGRQGESVTSFRAGLAETKAMLDAGENCNPHKGDPLSLGGDLPWHFPHNLLTSDGTWHEIGRTGWWGMRSDSMSEGEWVQHALDALAAEQDDSVVYYIDFHI